MTAMLSGNVRPGDFAVVRVHGPIGWNLTGMERLLRRRDFRYDHALIYAGNHEFVEALPWGVTITHEDFWLHGLYYDFLWSAGHIEPTAGQREKIVARAKGYAGTPYNCIEWLEAPCYAFSIWPWKQLWPKVMGSKMMMCSQTVAQVCDDAGMPLCGGLWPGYVLPADLAEAILAH